MLRSLGLASYVPVVRVTEENQYPYITFIYAEKDADGKNVAKNIYFSKRAAELVVEGQVITDSFFSDFNAAEVTITKTGELDWKLVSKGENSWKSTSGIE